jgi:hypothetical protein
MINLLLDEVGTSLLYLGRAIAQVVSRRLPTAVARVQIQAMSCGIFGEQTGSENGFLRVLRFPLPVLIPPTDPYSSSSGAPTIGPIVSSVQSGHSLTPAHEKKNICKYALFIITVVSISNPTYEVLRIWSFHSGGYEEFYFLVYNAV